MGNLSRHFDREEFMCGCGCGSYGMTPEFLAFADLTRDFLGEAIEPSSGFRCVKRNKDVGGKPASSHLAGFAMDVKTPDSGYRFRLVEAAMKAAKSLGLPLQVEIADWTHLSVDPTKGRNIMYPVSRA